MLGVVSLATNMARIIPALSVREETCRAPKAVGHRVEVAAGKGTGTPRSAKTHVSEGAMRG